MADLTIQTIGIAGVDRTAGFVAAAAGGDNFVNPGDERQFFDIINGDIDAMNVTFTAQVTSVKVGQHGTLTIPNIVVNLAASAEKSIGPFSQAYNDSAGKVQVTYDDETNVTVKAVRLPRVS